jgi:hypothetical protein
VCRCDVTAHYLLTQSHIQRSWAAVNIRAIVLYNGLLLNDVLHALCSSLRLYSKNCGSLGAGGRGVEVCVWRVLVITFQSVLRQQTCCVCANGVSVFRGRAGGVVLDFGLLLSP